MFYVQNQWQNQWGQIKLIFQSILTPLILDTYAQGEGIEVIEPVMLREEIAKSLQQAVKQYE